jgi:predicted metalloprotease
MRIGRMRTSGNVIDRRGLGGGGRVAVGGGVGGLILLLLMLVLGINPLALLGPGGGSSVMLPGGGPTTAEGQAAAEFVARVLGDTEDVWSDLFQRQGLDYVEPQLVLFSGAVESACGTASTAVGPFYCPLDSRIYIDLAFFDELSRRFGAPGDFAQAYVIAHEVGHHVQNLLGTADRVQAMRERMSESEYNQLSVRLELQADFYAGVWAHHAERLRDVLETGDIEEGVRAAEAIGDDRLQRRTQGYVVPDSFTHGTSEQRVRWFRKGLESGDPAAGDTFAARNP